MRTCTPPLAPKLTDNVTIHIVLNDFGERGRAFLETDELVADEWTIISKIISGEYSNPVRVVAFNKPRGGHAMSPRISRGPYLNAQRVKVT